MSLSLHTLLSRLTGVLILLSAFFLSTSLALATPSKRAALVLSQTWDIDVGAQLRESSTEGRTYGPKEIWINVGDTVIWHAASDIEHTVTFLAPGQKVTAFSPHNELQTRRQGGSHYDGLHYYNSGLMSNFPPGHEHDLATYSLRFDVTGDFTFHCLPHPAMSGIVHVRPAGTPYPYSAHDYYLQGLAILNQVRQYGQRLALQAQKYSTNHLVVVGIGSEDVSNFTFTPSLISIHTGDTVVFQYDDNIEEHTVTFGNSTQSNDIPYGNPNAFDGTTPFNSGWLCDPPACAHNTFKVTFTMPGTFILRDDLNKYTMLAQIIVQ